LIVSVGKGAAVGAVVSVGKGAAVGAAVSVGKGVAVGAAVSVGKGTAVGAVVSVGAGVVGTGVSVCCWVEPQPTSKPAAAAAPLLMNRLRVSFFILNSPIYVILIVGIQARVGVVDR
jgi:hypothetical protein